VAACTTFLPTFHSAAAEASRVFAFASYGSLRAGAAMRPKGVMFVMGSDGFKLTVGMLLTFALHSTQLSKENTK
jgi:hypothetical protein